MMILEERLKIGERVSWVCATLPSFALALMGFTGFLGFMRITGVAVMVVPALRAEKKSMPDRRTMRRDGYTGLRHSGLSRRRIWSYRNNGDGLIFPQILDSDAYQELQYAHFNWTKLLGAAWSRFFPDAAKYESYTSFL
jgi:hypothetical protein